MALDKSKFNPGGSPAGQGPAVHTYDAGTDPFGTVEADGYFDDLDKNMETGDMLYVYSSASSGGGQKLYAVTVTTNDVALSTGTSIS